MPVDVLVPPLGTNVDTLVLVEWYKAEGDPVEKGERLFSVETDKAVLDVEAPESGFLWGIAAAAGDEVAALTAIARIRLPNEIQGGPPLPLPSREQGEAVHGHLLSPATGEGDQALSLEEGERGDGESRVFASPRARARAERDGIDWRLLPGTGPAGAIVEADVIEALTKTAPRGETRSPLTGARAVIAERLARSSRETAPVTLTSETEASGLVAERARLRASGIETSYSDLLLAILGRAVREHPILNASLVMDEIVTWDRVDIGLAVDTPRGLVVPVVRNVDRLSLREITSETARLIRAAREGRLKPEEMRGATFTLTNLGMFGIDAFTPVINLPECAILGVGRIQLKPVVAGESVEVRPMVWLSLTFDHRLVDGAPAARFLQTVCNFVNDPSLRIE